MVLNLLLVCVLLAIIPIRNKKIEFFVFTVILGVMISIFAGCNESTDQFAYKVLYTDNAYFPVEKGYILLTQIFSTIGFDYTMFKASIMLISSLLVFWRFKDCNNQINYRMVLLLWLATSYWFDIEQSRYAIAMSLVIFATRYLEKSYRFGVIKYIILILLAFSIHTACIVFLLLLFTHIEQKKLNLASIFACVIAAIIRLFCGTIPQLGQLLYSIIPNERVLMWFSFSTKLGWVGPVLMQFMTYVMVWYSNQTIQRNNDVATQYDKQTASLVLKISTILFWVIPLYFYSTEFIRIIRGFFIVYFFIVALSISFSTHSQKLFYAVYMIVFVVAFNLQGLRGILFYNDYFVENMIMKNDLNKDLQILFFVFLTMLVFFLLANTNKKVRGLDLLEKSLKKNVIYNSLYQVVAIVTPIITAPYLARTIGAEGNGVYNYTLTYANFFFLFAMLGVNNYGTRMIAQVKSDKQALSRTFWEIYTLQLILSVILTVLYLVFVFCVFQPEERLLSLLQGLAVLAAATDINWFAFGVEEFKYTTIRNLIIKILSLISIFVFVREKTDTWIYILIVECGVIMGLLALWPLVKQKTDFYKPCIKGMIKHLRPNLLLFIPILATSVFQYTDKMMLGIFINNDAVGHYSYAESIMNVPLSLITAVCTVFMPRISNMISEKKSGANELFEKSLYLTTILEIAMVFGVAAVAPRFISLFLGVEFAETARLLVILSVVILLSGTANVIRTMLLIPNSKDVLYVWSVIFGAVFNVIGNVFLLPRYGATGACVSTIASYFIVLLIQMIGSRRDVHYFPYVMKMIPFAFLGIAMYFLIQLMDSRLNWNSWLLLFLEVIVGVVLYCCGSFIVVSICRFMKRKDKIDR